MSNTKFGWRVKLRRFFSKDVDTDCKGESNSWWIHPIKEPIFVMSEGTFGRCTKGIVKNVSLYDLDCPLFGPDTELHVKACDGMSGVNEYLKTVAPGKYYLFTNTGHTCTELVVKDIC